MSRSLSFFLILSLSGGVLEAAPAVSQLAKGGKAQLKVTVSEKASQGTLALAKEMADYLSKISGAAFETEIGDGSSGIVLGLPASEWPWGPRSVGSCKWLGVVGSHG